MVQNNKFKEVVLAEALKEQHQIFIDKAKKVRFSIIIIRFILI